MKGHWQFSKFDALFTFALISGYLFIHCVIFFFVAWSPYLSFSHLKHGRETAIFFNNDITNSIVMLQIYMDYTIFWGLKWERDLFSVNPTLHTQTDSDAHDFSNCGWKDADKNEFHPMNNNGTNKLMTMKSKRETLKKSHSIKIQIDFYAVEGKVWDFCFWLPMN